MYQPRHPDIQSPHYFSTDLVHPWHLHTVENYAVTSAKEMSKESLMNTQERVFLFSFGSGVYSTLWQYFQSVINHLSSHVEKNMNNRSLSRNRLPGSLGGCLKVHILWIKGSIWLWSIEVFWLGFGLHLFVNLNEQKLTQSSVGWVNHMHDEWSDDGMLVELTWASGEAYILSLLIHHNLCLMPLVASE